MHIRVSTAVGIPVIADQEEELVGKLSYPLINPDTGTIAGFYLQRSGFFSEEAFIAASSISSWGTAVHIRSIEYVSPPEDILRISALLKDPRRVLLQRIMTKESKQVLGRCMDVQFDTKTCVIEWLFPRRFFMLRSPIPANEIVEITPKAIIVREPIIRVPAEAEVQKKDLGFPEVLPVAS